MGKIINEFSGMLFAYHNKIYPSFIYKRIITEKFPPVFYYHNINRSEFENQLIYLKNNGYVSVFCDEYIDVIFGKIKYYEQKPIMLTFDDGLSSLYIEVFPLIVKYNVKIVAYIVPTWIGKPGFLNWDQCREMHKTGLVDFQSHSLTHSNVVTNITITELKPMKNIDMPWDIPGMYMDNLKKEFRLLPIFHGNSLFEVKSAFTIPDIIWKELLIHEKVYISNHSIPNSLKNINYLIKYYNQYLKNNGDRMQCRNRKEIYEEIIYELKESKNRIESKLPGHKVNHFAFPWSKSSTMAWQALKEEGYKSGAVVLNVNNERFCKDFQGIKLYRVNGDFVYCLPGKKRVSFFFIMKKKIYRRIKSREKNNLLYE